MSNVVRAKSTLVSIQVLRGIAAMLVVVHHAITFLNDKYAARLPEFDLGAIGVDVFFVISGFIMFLTTRGHDGSWYATTQFLMKRAVRIMPLYWLVTLSLALVLFLFPSLFKSMQLNSVWLLKSLFFIPYMNEVNLPHPMVDPGWTLNYEMFFYVVFGLCLWAFRAWVAIACVLVLAANILIGALLETDNVILSVYSSPLLLEFCAGLLCGVFYQKFGVFRPSVGVMILVVTILWLSIVQPNFPVSDLQRSISWGGGAVLVVMSFLSFEGILGGRRALALPTLIGDASYSIYLVHTLFFLAFSKLAGAFGVLFHGPVWLVLGAGVFGVMTYRLVEQPLGRVASRITQPRRHGLVSAASADEISR